MLFYTLPRIHCCDLGGGAQPCAGFSFLNSCLISIEILENVHSITTTLKRHFFVLYQNRVSNEGFFKTIVIITNQLLLFIAASVDKIFLFNIVSFKNFK